MVAVTASDEEIRFPDDSAKVLPFWKPIEPGLALPDKLPPAKRMVALGMALCRTTRPWRTEIVPLNEWFPLDGLNSRSPVPFLVMNPVPERFELGPKVVFPLEVRNVAFCWMEMFINPPASARMPEISRFEPGVLERVAFPEMFNDLKDVAE